MVTRRANSICHEFPPKVHETGKHLKTSNTHLDSISLLTDWGVLFNVLPNTDYCAYNLSSLVDYITNPIIHCVVKQHNANYP
mmetsp:Transcript_26149/g.38728  ORF Transcript_26149/g.38728 Transcript_26149/m.38728 type:complete len:82 (-) Transcript_26149:1193-1438(-)